MPLEIEILARDKYKRGGVNSINGIKIVSPENRIYNNNKDINLKTQTIKQIAHIRFRSKRSHTATKQKILLDYYENHTKL